MKIGRIAKQLVTLAAERRERRLGKRQCRNCLATGLAGGAVYSVCQWLVR
ncbi:MAG TPA: hypothetical protein PKA10_09560 [Selenomonadales bacterium]|nr:hypothetical protein [Selenomonadales bacterium]